MMLAARGETDGTPIRFRTDEITWSETVAKRHSLDRGDGSHAALRRLFCGLYEGVTALHDAARERFTPGELRMIEGADAEWARSFLGSGGAKVRTELVVRLMGAGLDVDTIAATVRADRCDVEQVADPARSDKWARIRSMLLDGCRVMEVSRACNIDRKSVRRIALLLGVARQRNSSTLKPDEVEFLRREAQQGARPCDTVRAFHERFPRSRVSDSTIRQFHLNDEKKRKAA